MIAVDDNDCSLFALEWALSNLKPNLTASAGVILFTVIPIDYSTVVASSYDTAALVDVIPELMTSIQENQKRAAIGLLIKARNLCATHGIDAEAAYKFGNAKEAICQAVDKNHVRLLIVGRHRRGVIQRCLDSNLVEIPVHIEAPDRNYYHVAFFTTRKVDANEELTWDYGIEFDGQGSHLKTFHCLCGSSFCRNLKRSNGSNPTPTAH